MLDSKAGNNSKARRTKILNFTSNLKSPLLAKATFKEFCSMTRPTSRAQKRLLGIYVPTVRVVPRLCEFWDPLLLSPTQFCELLSTRSMHRRFYEKDCEMKCFYLRKFVNDKINALLRCTPGMQARWLFNLENAISLWFFAFRRASVNLVLR